MGLLGRRAGRPLVMPSSTDHAGKVTTSGEAGKNLCGYSAVVTELLKSCWRWWVGREKGAGWKARLLYKELCATLGLFSLHGWKRGAQPYLLKDRGRSAHKSNAKLPFTLVHIILRFCICTQGNSEQNTVTPMALTEFPGDIFSTCHSTEMKPHEVVHLSLFVPNNLKFHFNFCSVGTFH